MSSFQIGLFLCMYTRARGHSIRACFFAVVDGLAFPEFELDSSMRAVPFVPERGAGGARHLFFLIYFSKPA
jgi:hypothetical protein